MISYTTLGSNNLAKAVPFYDKLLGVLGFETVVEHRSGGRIYGKEGRPMFGIVSPYDGEPATVGNGTMIVVDAEDHAAVQRFHETALALGGACDGAPGYRGPAEAKAYMAYVRDLDGNKIAAMKLG
jgi:catechol 2,3-dioxygenase-like lactoylglutathione lyase family enzyme